MSCPCCNSDYHKVGLLALRDNRILLCRKSRGASLLILPGGCLEQQETAAQCLQRELQEELGVSATNTGFIGTYIDNAAGESRKTVRIDLYHGDLTGRPEPQSEIADLIWFGPTDDRTQLAPSIARKILPDLIRRNILPWSA
ncbi:MAG TPA: NUDIX domain-containing protein [Bryobacteraceae bacterium]|nr:NUDIX domain-containing protein [Bryobacteraceae bacterium]